MHQHYFSTFRPAATANAAIPSQTTGTRMFYHSLELCKTSPARNPGHPAAPGQQNSLEDPLRLDRDSMQHNSAWPGQTLADVSAVHVRYENFRNPI